MRQMSPFEYYIRTGRILTPPDAVETKFNPWHDSENGRFTHEGQGGYFGGGQSAGGISRLRTGNFRQTRPAAPVISKIVLPEPKRIAWEGQDSAKPLRDTADFTKRFRRERPLPPRVVERFKQHMIPEEKDRNDVYRDNLQVLTVGIGHKVLPADNLKEGDIISEARKEAFWKQDSKEALLATREQMVEAGLRDPKFVLPLASVNFQLGSAWSKDHVKTWALIVKGDYKGAAQEAENSDWFKFQTPDRVRAFQKALLALPPKPRSK